MFQKFINLLHLGSLQFRKVLKFFFVISGQTPLPEFRPAPRSLALAHCWSEPAPLKLSCSAWRISVPLAWQAAAMDQAHSGTFLRIRKVQNLFSTSPCEETHQQAGFGDNPGKHYWVCWDTTACSTKHQQRDSPHLLEKKWLDDFILIYIQVDLALENVICFMLLRKVRFQDSFISLFIILWAPPLAESTYLLLRSCFYRYIGDQKIGA